MQAVGPVISTLLHLDLLAGAPGGDWCQYRCSQRLPLTEVKRGIMYDAILTAIDGSPCGQWALGEAMALASAVREWL